jgi:hypothetical protein
MAYAIDIADSDSVNLGSNPSPPAIQFKPPPMSRITRTSFGADAAAIGQARRWRTAQPAYSPCARLNSSSAS